MAARVDRTVRDPQNPVIGIVGGTGAQGRGLATRWAIAGLSVMIGSRDALRAAECAAQLPGNVNGVDNCDVGAQSDIVVIAVPWTAHEQTLVQLSDGLSGQIVIDCVNPLAFDSRGAHVLDVADGSAAEQAARLLPASTVVGAFHHVSAVLLLDPAVESVDSDVLVVGDDEDAVNQVVSLADLIPGVRGVYAGGLRNARQVEALTANLIAINRQHRGHAGVRITGINSDQRGRDAR